MSASIGGYYLGFVLSNAGQDIVAASGSTTTGTAFLLHTVTAGKKLYVTSATLQADNTSGTIALHDGTPGAGTVRFLIEVGGLANTPLSVSFATPLEFLDSVYVEAGASGLSKTGNISGWEQ